MGRRSVLTVELRETLERELADGVSPRIAAERVGVSTSSVYSWLADGRIERRRASVPAAVELAPVAELEPGELDVRERVRRAEAALVMSVVRAATREGRWHAAAWLLERSAPERWAGRSRRQPPPRAPRSRTRSRSWTRSPFGRVRTARRNRSRARRVRQRSRRNRS